MQGTDKSTMIFPSFIETTVLSPCDALCPTFFTLVASLLYPQVGDSGPSAGNREYFPASTSILWLLRTSWSSLQTGWSPATDRDVWPPLLPSPSPWARPLPLTSSTFPPRCGMSPAVSSCQENQLLVLVPRGQKQTLIKIEPFGIRPDQ